MRILGIHGIGRHDDNVGSWENHWQSVIKHGIETVAPATAVEFDFLRFDPIFEPFLANLSWAEYGKAVWNLASGAITSQFRGIFDLPESQRWYAGMVAVFVNHEDLRAQLREAFAAKIDLFKPDVIACHSLGTLLGYDLFSQDDSARVNRVLLTFGSQLGNTFVRGMFGGRVSPFSDMPWFHLWNENDAVFASAPLDFGDFQTEPNFQQIETRFGAPVALGNGANHGAVVDDDAESDQAYLSHPQTRALLWPQLTGRFVTRSLGTKVTVAQRVAPEKETAVNPQKRAVLVGINVYARDDIPRLEGCVNDVFLVSEVLQESGFAADEIRVVLDDRATLQGIQERLHWLLDNVRADDERFFYFSGHGAMLPIYGPAGEVDRACPCLVPHDFRWTKDSAVTDDTLINFYSQLPYDSHFMMVLDCCHAGALTRGTRQPRGITPPDDIRHRLLRWNPKLGMWEQRSLNPPNKDISKQKDAEMYLGPSGAELRLGRAIDLRTIPNKEFDRERKDRKHKGPFFPIILEACEAAELAYEYQHGVISYGAFTFAIANVLRRAKGKLSYADLVKQTGTVLKSLGYDQHPVAAGPKEIVKKIPPWTGEAAKK